MQGAGLTLLDSGDGNRATLNGDAATATLAGVGGNVAVNGNGSTVRITGASTVAAVNGAGSTALLGGEDNRLATSGSTVLLADGARRAAVAGGGNTVIVGSLATAAVTSSGGLSLVFTGSGAALTATGGYGQATLRGSQNRLDLDGTANQVALEGAANTLHVIGVAARIDVAGLGHTISANEASIRLATGARASLGGNGNLVALDAGAELAATGVNTWIQAQGSDSITLSGAGSGLAAGAGSTVALLGNGQYARMSGGTLTLSAARDGALRGDGNHVQAGAGATLAVTGTGNAVQASHAAILFDPAPPAGAAFQVRGFSFAAARLGDYSDPAATASLAGLAETGANAVELVVTQFLHDAGRADDTAVTISRTEGTETDAALLAQIGQAQARGLHVLLKPHVDVADGMTWRALLKPYDTARFFANYEAFIVHYAQIAQQAGVGTFCIGAEMQSLSGAEYRLYWTGIIQAVRQVYSGQITYASAAFETAGVSFWDRLDVIGANAYERVTSKDNPTLEELEAGWSQPTPPALDPIGKLPQAEGFGGKSPIQFYRDLAQQYGKQVLFTEAGYSSVNATNRLQGDGRRNALTTVDFQQQARAQEAFLKVWSANGGDWLQGVYLWNWNPNPDAVTAYDPSIQGKPALDVVRAWYGGAPPAPRAGTTAWQATATW